MLDLSIIIPIYNVEKYLTSCLESVKKVTEKLNTEVIMIDDGSTDGSGTIAKEFAGKYEAFSYYYQENGGQGKARNYGATLATGKYLWFVDSDDLVDEEVALHMFALAEQKKTDLTICDAARIKGKKISAAEAFLYTFHNLTENVSHITKHPAFVYDTMVWNKLIRRDFYKKHGFRFPEGCFYEDVPWNIEVHYRAKNVAILHEVGYYWRIREGENQSVTQQKQNINNLKDRISMFQMAFDFLDKNAKYPEIRKMLEIRQWGFEYVGYLNMLEDMEESLAREFLSLLSRYVEKNMTADAYESLPLIHQQLIADILKEDLEHLIRVNNYRKTNYQNAPILQGELLANNEIFTIPNRKADNEFRWKPARCSLDLVDLKEHVLSLEGHIYYRKIPVAAGEQAMRAYMMHTLSGKKVELEVLPVECQWLTKEQGTVLNYDDYRKYKTVYDGVGFSLKLDFKMIENQKLETGTYKVFIEQENQVVSSARILRGAKKEIQDIVQTFAYESEKIEVGVSFDKRETMQIDVVKKTQTFWEKLKK